MDHMVPMPDDLDTRGPFCMDCGEPVDAVIRPPCVEAGEVCLPCTYLLLGLVEAVPSPTSSSTEQRVEYARN